ncbi:MAG: hypothetical protein ACRC1K_22915, partial [Planctomycetia bacterium]
MNRRRLRVPSRSVVFPRILAVVLVASASPSNGAEPADGVTVGVLQAAADRRLDLALEADGAYKLTVRLRNLGAEPLKVEFGSGLIADAFGSNEVIAQILGPQAGLQGMAILDTPTVLLAAGGAGAVELRTVCMNYGKPEPDGRTLLFLKSVEEYTAEVGLRAAARAAVGRPTLVAQTLVWRAGGVTWEVLARQSVLGK